MYFALYPDYTVGLGVGCKLAANPLRRVLFNAPVFWRIQAAFFEGDCPVAFVGTANHPNAPTIGQYFARSGFGLFRTCDEWFMAPRAYAAQAAWDAHG